MAQEAFVILIYLIIHHGFLVHELLIDALFEARHYLFENRLVENELLTAHHAGHIATCEQLTTLEYDAVGARIERVYP